MTARERYVTAAVTLAATVATQRRIATDVDYPADRSPRADELRAQYLVDEIDRFNAAESAYLAGVTG